MMMYTVNDYGMNMEGMLMRIIGSLYIAIFGVFQVLWHIIEIAIATNKKTTRLATVQKSNLKQASVIHHKSTTIHIINRIYGGRVQY